MRKQDILHIYLDQFQRAEKAPYYGASELKAYVSFCEKLHEDEISHRTLSHWLKHRAQTCSSNTLVSIQNSIAKFAKWARFFDPTIGFIQKKKHSRSRRRKPVILDFDQVRKIASLQGSCVPNRGISPKTYSTLTSFLFVTGLRIGEALAMELDHINLTEREIYVPSGKGERDRVVCLSKSSVNQLLRYCLWTKKIRSNRKRFFIFDKNYSDRYNKYRKNFNMIATELGFRKVESLGRDRSNLVVNDLRHSFAVASLIKIYERADDTNEAVNQLSYIMGHEQLDHTYWYIEAVPMLKAAAYKRCRS